MSDQDKIAAILSAIQDPSKLMLLMRAIIANNIGNVSTEQLTNLCNLLGIAQE